MMSEDLLLGIDIGTQGTKGILCDLDGNVLAESYREHATQSPHPGWAEQNPDALHRVAVEVMTSTPAELRAKVSAVASP